MYVETLIVTIFLPVFLFLWKIMFTTHASALKKKKKWDICIWKALFLLSLLKQP